MTRRSLVNITIKLRELHTLCRQCGVSAYDEYIRGRAGYEISSFVYLPAGTVELQPYYFSIVLGHYAFLDVSSVLALFVIFGGLFLYNLHVDRPS